jgi:predicted nucleic acid-binding protein
VFLLDTNVFSELRKARPHGAVLAWVASTPPSSMFISAMTIAEIQAGVERTRERDTQKAAEIEAWMLGMLETSQVLAMGLDVARIWAKIMHGKSKSLAEDAWIAATAKSHNLVVATRNVHDFGGFGVDVFNPFADIR